MATIIRKTMSPIRTLYFSMQSGSFKKLHSNVLSLKQRNTSDRLFFFLLSASTAVIRLVFFPEKILLKL